MSGPAQRESTGPWYRHRWPWLLVLLPLTAVVVASFVTLWLAVRQPDYLVVEDAEYDEIRSGLRAQQNGTADEPAGDDEPR